MQLKNWAFCLFHPDGALFHQGFTNVRPTPSISMPDRVLTPDLVAWGNGTILVIECCSGTPNSGDFDKVERYSRLPSTSYAALTGILKPLIESILLYYENKFESDRAGRDDLLRAVSLRSDIIVWTCIPSLVIRSEAGSHSSNTLESTMRGGAPLGRFPSPQIEIQPDSPEMLVARVMLRRLFELAMRTRDTSFTLVEAQQSVIDQNYALQTSEEERKLRRAIQVGLRLGLCEEESPGVRWRLNFYHDRPMTIERFLSRLTGMLSQPGLTDFWNQS
jgi:hypothetical protein